MTGIRRVSSISNGMAAKDTIASLLASLMEVVRTTVACECVYVRAMVIKALIWMQSPHESFDELESIIASELSDPSWPATLLNDVLLTLHARFKVCLELEYNAGPLWYFIFIYSHLNFFFPGQLTISKIQIVPHFTFVSICLCISFTGCHTSCIVCLPTFLCVCVCVFA